MSLINTYTHTVLRQKKKRVRSQKKIYMIFIDINGGINEADQWVQSKQRDIYIYTPQTDKNHTNLKVSSFYHL